MTWYYNSSGYCWWRLVAGNTILSCNAKIWKWRMRHGAIWSKGIGLCLSQNTRNHDRLWSQWKGSMDTKINLTDRNLMSTSKINSKCYDFQFYSLLYYCHFVESTYWKYILLFADFCWDILAQLVPNILWDERIIRVYSK